MNNLWLYGPPGSGKSTLGKLIAERLDLPFVDLDRTIEAEADAPIGRIFATEGESGFRAREKRALEDTATRERCVVALGGGALLDGDNRARVETDGTVVCLDCSLETLRNRIALAPGKRPLAGGGDGLAKLVASRAAHYASFRRRLVVDGRSLAENAAAAESLFGAWRILGGDVPSFVHVVRGGLDGIGRWAAAHDFGRRAVVVADANVFPLYGERVLDGLRAAGVEAASAVIPAGEPNKTLETVQSIWGAFQRAGLGRGDFAVAVGGGVTGDMTGFAAATWMRGMRWVNVPTTMLAMVDASTGGKTGCDLPGAKNMIGAFHSPSLVLADVETLRTLPAREWRCGLAETIKHLIIGDPGLADYLPRFTALCGRDDAAPFDGGGDSARLAEFLARSLAVKVRIVREDPYEKGPRAKLNLGHTVGHAVEMATDFRYQHGEAVAIGTVEEARLALRLGLVKRPEWPDEVAALFASVGLPTALPPSLSFDSLRPIMLRDKKKRGNEVRFALPLALGETVPVPVAL